MKVDLTGLNVLVTGGSRGIGAGICHGLIAAGARVAVQYRSAGEAAEAVIREGEGMISANENNPPDGPEDPVTRKSQAFQADLSSPEGCTQLFLEAIEAFGHLDVLVNNAGVAIHSPIDKPSEQWLADWEKTMAVNLTATALLSRLAIQHFQERGGGRMIHISSRAAFRGDTPEYLAYAASKAGMVSLHRSIARGYGKQGIKSFLIAPGFVRTDMAQDFIDTYGEEHAVSDLALDTLTEPKDLAPTVVLLASGLADHATGSTIDINAGSYVH